MFNNGMAAPSLSDIAAVTNNNDGFGGNNGWWILIILFALFGGWGNNGWNNGGSRCGSGGGCASVGDVQSAVNQQTLYTKLDGQTYGIADLGYTLNSQFAAAELSRANQQAALTAQLSQVHYDAATNASLVTNAINQAAQQIMQNDNANYRQLHDENVTMQMEALKTQIAQRDTEIFNLQLRASQQEQNNYLIGQLKTCPVPAYVVPNPYCNCGTTTNSCCNC